jgi:hypothetical protein
MLVVKYFQIISLIFSANSSIKKRRFKFPWIFKFGSVIYFTLLIDFRAGKLDTRR